MFEIVRSEMLLEILTEEIPARMQVKAAEDLQSLFAKEMTALGYGALELASYVTPRRLVLQGLDLPDELPAQVTEKRGPRIGAPEAAIQGFLASSGFTSLNECEQRATDKGEFWFAKIVSAAQITADILPGVIQRVITGFPWPKSMRWGQGATVWVRPITSVMCLYNHHPLRIAPWDRHPESTVGHRFMAPEVRIAPKSFQDYQAQLMQAYVILDRTRRRDEIAKQLKDQALGRGLQLIEDQGLVEEVTGLVEWPHVMVGRIDEAHMALPVEVLQTVMRQHQRYFSLADAQGNMAPFFAAVANIVPTDGGKIAIRGYERVLRARLADATFFWSEDLARPLLEHARGLDQLVFHARLGTIADKISRMRRMAPVVAQSSLAPMFGLHTADGFRELLEAIDLCKADLCTQMVREFPELQGIMGRCYALLAGCSEAVAYAIEHHYAPQSPDQEAPKWPLSMALALIDKIDTLVGFFAIGEKPTGSKDPFALRRTALGVLRLALDNHLLDLDVREMIETSAAIYRERGLAIDDKDLEALPDFLSDRLRVLLRDRGLRHDVVQAVTRRGDNPVWSQQCAYALQAFLTQQEGQDLLQAFRRVTNILKSLPSSEVPDPQHFVQTEESALFAVAQSVKHDVQTALAQRPLPRYREALAAFGKLGATLQAFFDQVTVNVDDAALRQNRLALLSMIRAIFIDVADFAALEG